MSVTKAIDGGMLPPPDDYGLDYDQPILPTEPRVIRRYCDPGYYPNTVTPRSIETAVRERVAAGTDVFEAMRQVLEGVARWRRG